VTQQTGEPLGSESRNATEEAILDAAREALADTPYRRLTMDVIARRAFTSRTALYFYFPNKRALVDRLIARAFLDMYEAASPYLDGSGDPRAELRRGLARTVKVIDHNAHVLTLAAALSGEEDRLPPQWAPYVVRFVEGAVSRITRDQERGIAPADIPPRLAAQALLAMVERHVTLELIQGGGDAHQSIRVLAELWWRAVYSKPATEPPAE
jgi:AcrR family transcriptional regulator